MAYICCIAPNRIFQRSWQGFDDQCLGYVASLLRPAAFGAGEVIYERGERGDEMYLVVDGTVVLHTHLAPPCSERTIELQAQQCEQQQALRANEDRVGDSGVVKSAGKGKRLAGKGDVFGEAGLFPAELGPHRQESVTTLSRVMAYVLNAAALQEIAGEYPEVRLCGVNSRSHGLGGHSCTGAESRGVHPGREQLRNNDTLLDLANYSCVY
jgi:CRP-like cAMP-binding protein